MAKGRRCCREKGGTPPRVVPSAAEQAAGRSRPSQEPLLCPVRSRILSGEAGGRGFCNQDSSQLPKHMLGLGLVAPQQHAQRLRRFAMLNTAQGALPAGQTHRPLHLTNPTLQLGSLVSSLRLGTRKAFPNVHPNLHKCPNSTDVSGP